MYCYRQRAVGCLEAGAAPAVRKGWRPGAPTTIEIASLSHPGAQHDVARSV